MRRVSIVLAGCLLAALAAASLAEAKPTVRFKALPVPITGFPHTGYILGAGAALEAEYKISGTEYGGFPPPVIGINVYFPKGTALHTPGFPTCPKTELEQVGSKGCPAARPQDPSDTRSASSPSAPNGWKSRPRSNPSTPPTGTSSSSPSDTRPRRWKSSPRATT